MLRRRTRLEFAALAATVLSVCVWLWLRNSRPAYDESAAARETTPVPTAESRLSSDALTAAEPAPARVPAESPGDPVPAQTAAPSRQRGRIFGSLLDASGSPIQGAWSAGVRLHDRAGRQRFCDAKDTGDFEFAGLELGTYWLSAGAHAHLPATDTVELRLEAPEVRRDFTLRDQIEIRIRVSTPDGMSFLDAWKERRPTGSLEILVPIATKERPVGRFVGVTGSLNNKFGVGTFWNYGPRVKALPEGYLGLVQLDVDPPVWMSLVNYESVLQSVLVERGTTEVEFVLTPDALLATFARLRLQVVDAATSLPIEGARLQFNDAGGVMTYTTDREGRFELPGLAPGHHELSVEFAGHAGLRKRFEAAAGEITDLGTLALELGVKLDAVVLDTDGRPRAARFSLGTLDPATGTIAWLSRISFGSKEDGRLQIRSLTRAQYALRTDNLDALNAEEGAPVPWVSGIVLFDTRGAIPSPLEIRLRKGVRLAVLSGQMEEGSRIRVVDDRGLEVLRSRLYGSAPRPLDLPPGTYRVALLDPEGTVVAERAVALAVEPVMLDFTR